MTVAHLLIVGAGPAGLAAAAAAASSGCRVTLIDGNPRPGGQYYRHLPAGQVADQQALHVDWAHGVRLLAAANRAGIEHRYGTWVWSAIREQATGAIVLRVLSEDGAEGEVRGDAVVLATGAYDRALPFPGWDLPGVLTPGGAQALLKGQYVLAGKRVLVGGSGPFLLPVAAGLADAGATVVAVVEASRPRRWVRHPGAVATNLGKLREGAHYAARLARHRVPVRVGAGVVRVEGEIGVDRAVVAVLDAAWRPVPGTDRVYDVDTVCVGFGFIPSVELAVTLGCEVRTDPLERIVLVRVDDRQATTVPGVYAAGELTGIGGNTLAEAEGRLAGLAAAAVLRSLDAAAFVSQAAPVRRIRNRSRAFARALHDVHAIRPGWIDWVDDDTLVCRCEEVTVGTLRGAIHDLGATDLRSAKLLTRVGMGFCQGRVCGHAAAWLIGAESGHDTLDQASIAGRPLAVPVPLATLAGSTALSVRPGASDAEGKTL